MAELTGLDLLKSKIRPYKLLNDIDKENYSHSKLETFVTCPYQYKFKYEDRLTDDSTTLALQLGSLCHYILETKFRMIDAGQEVDYDKLFNMLEEGVHEDGKDLIGITELSGKYFEEWYAPDTEGTTYPEKIERFKNVVKDRMDDTSIWKPWKAEQEFYFIYDDKYSIHGFIDRIDINKKGELRVCDYKTSKKIFIDSKVNTSQQFGIYALACLALYGKLPVEYMYDFIFLDTQQYALSKGWEGRIIKKLDKIFSSIEEDKNSNIWKPNPGVLCHWCSYCKTNPDAKGYKDKCEYFCKWTRETKDFSVNKVFSEEEYINEANNKSKGSALIF